jgi:anti-sigma regulatory factor (Ser/Thr protein kinase)
MEEHRISFPKQATIAYVDSFLKAVRGVLNAVNSRVVLDLSKTSEVSAVLICFLCGLVDMSQAKNNDVGVILPRNVRAAKAIRSVKELTRRGDSPIRITQRMCQARKITGNNNAYLQEILQLLAENIRISEKAQDSLLVVLTELLTNAIDHSGEKSCYVCAGTWGRSKSLHLTLLDFGMGIPQKMRTRYPEYDEDVEAIKALLKKGLTTRIGLEGGRGYKFIQEILRRNKGRLHIFSGKAKIVFKYDKGEYHFRKARRGFTGTCVDIQFNLESEGFDAVVEELGKEEIFS